MQKNFVALGVVAQNKHGLIGWKHLTDAAEGWRVRERSFFSKEKKVRGWSRPAQAQHSLTGTHGAAFASLGRPPWAMDHGWQLKRI